MRPARRTGNGWFATLLNERRTGLVALGLMLLVLVALMIFQRLVGAPETGRDTPVESENQEAAPVAAEETGQSGTPGAAETTPAAQPAPVTRLGWPLEAQRRIVMEYGAMDRSLGDYRLYPGLALAARIGAPVMAGASGRVVVSEESQVDGGLVLIDYGNGLLVRYSGLGVRHARPGEMVRAGQVLGEVGAPTAARTSMGAHVALTVQVNGDTVNPATYFAD